jgi:hypothetical protein
MTTAVSTDEIQLRAHIEGRKSANRHRLPHQAPIQNLQDFDELEAVVLEYPKWGIHATDSTRCD